MGDEATSAKRSATCLDKYGTTNVFSTGRVKEKIAATKIRKYGNPHYVNSEKALKTLNEKYGCDNFGKVPGAKENKERTCMERYGTSNCMRSADIKETRVRNNIEKYGVPSTNMLETTKEKYKITCMKRYGTEYAGQALVLREKKRKNKIRLYNTMLKNAGYSGEVLDYTHETVKYRCGICGEVSEILMPTFSGRLYEKCINPCLYCNPLEKPYSCLEKEVLDYIASIYTGTVVENDRTALHGKELDIYLPDRNLAFEVDGTYWHADPRFYEALDTIGQTGLYATAIWERDFIKDRECAKRNIKLVRIKEYDWKHNKDDIKKMIYNTINKVSRMVEHPTFTNTIS
jgi:hypothetical protein